MGAQASLPAVHRHLAGVNAASRMLANRTQDACAPFQFNGNFVNAEMVKAFISSDEYRQRFLR